MVGIVDKVIDAAGHILGSACTRCTGPGGVDLGVGVEV